MTAPRCHALAAARIGFALCATTPALSFAQSDSAAIRVHSPDVTGDLRLHRFTSKVFANTRYLRVLVPDGYDAPENRDRQYPVLYLADGQNLFDPATSVFARSEWKVDETVHQLVAAGRIGPLIVVGVDDAGRDARAHEYLPWPDTATRYANPHYDPAPQGARYPEFLIDEVMPYINAHYRTLRGPSHTAIGGSSYGALISTYVVMVRQGDFGMLLAESPTFNVYGDEIIHDAASIGTWPQRVYIGVGTNEGASPDCRPDKVPDATAFMVDNVHRIESVLQTAGLDSSRLRVVVTPCGTHTHEAWAARLPAALTFLFSDRH
jgi:predicted alpha/beta superfamily hydrolase